MQKHITSLSIKDHGYTIVENLFSDTEIQSMHFYHVDYEYPYQFNVLKGGEINFNFSKVVDFANYLTGLKYSVFMQKVNFKPEFCGSSEIFHQDYYYRRNLGIEPDKYLQVFIALEDLSYAPLNVFEGSHKLGLLEHKKCLERTGRAKWCIENQVLNRYKDKYKTIYLKKGSALFFDYRLIHGSSSNASPFPQPRAIVQLCTENLKCIQHGSDRRDFETKILKKFLDEKI